MVLIVTLPVAVVGPTVKALELVTDMFVPRIVRTGLLITFVFVRAMDPTVPASKFDNAPEAVVVMIEVPNCEMDPPVALAPILEALTVGKMILPAVATKLDVLPVVTLPPVLVT